MPLGNSTEPELKAALERAERFERELSLSVNVETSLMAQLITDAYLPNNPIIFVNDAYLRLTGFERADVLGVPVTALLSSDQDAKALNAVTQLIKSGGSGVWKMQCRHQNKIGFVAAVLTTPLKNNNNIVIQNILSFVELSQHDRKKDEELSRMHMMYENAPGFIATTRGSDHRFNFANASYKRFVEKDNLEGLTVAEALPEIVDQGFISLLDEVYSTGEPFIGRNVPMQIVNETSGSIETRYCDFVYQAVTDINDIITGLFCEGYDVTKQHETADALSLLQSQAIHIARVNAAGSMATMLAHELNQPLSAIRNYTTGIKRSIDSADPQYERLLIALQGIEEASHRAAEVIRNLKELTRRRHSERTSFDLKAAIGECVRLLRATVSPDIDIVDETPPEMFMLADRVQIQQIIINLLRNACDAVMGSRRRLVKIASKQAKSGLIVSVTDTGPGVEMEAAEQIFSWSDTLKDEGMGLGLSICRTIIEGHGGQIWLENSGSHGSEFCFSVPVPEQSPEAIVH